MTRTIDLPNLSSLYGRAALSAVKSKLSSNGSLRGLQVQPVVAQHPGITEEQLEDYRRLFAGEAFDRTHRSALPSVLIHIAAFPVQMGLMSGRDFPLALLGMVHLANTVEHHQPIMANTPLQILVDAKNFRPHRKGTQVDITVDVYPQGVDVDSAEPSALLWSGVSTYLGIGSLRGGQTRGGAGPARPGRIHPAEEDRTVEPQRRGRTRLRRRLGGLQSDSRLQHCGQGPGAARGDRPRNVLGGPHA